MKKRLFNKYSKVMKIAFAFIFLFFNVSTGLGQNPCSTPINATVNVSGTGCSAFLTGTMITEDLSNPIGSAAPCVITDQLERWVKFTAIAPTATIIVTQNAVGAQRDLAIVVYSGSCGSLTQIACANNNVGPAVETESVILTGLIYSPATDYYIRIINEGSATNFSTRVCITSTPINDEPSGAIPIPVGSTPGCTTTTSYNNYFSTNSNCSPSVPNPSCPSYTAGVSQDVWYSLVVPASGNLIVNTSGQIYGIALYSGTNSPGCGSMSEVICTTSGSAINPGFAGFSLTGLTPGTYYLRAWKNGGGVSAFNICATSVPITPPVNDEPCGATSSIVSANTACATNSVSLYGATPSIPLPSCAGLISGVQINDVWAQFTATAPNHSLTINSVLPNNLANKKVYVAMYATTPSVSCASGVVAGSELSCLSTTVINTTPFTYQMSGLTTGQTYLIRFFNYSAPGYSTTINYCVITPPPPLNDNCTGAIVTTTNSSAACTTTISGTLYGATSSTNTNSCAGGFSDDDVWYSFVAGSTMHNINITSTADLYHSVYAGNCGAIGVPLVCSDPNTSNLTGLIVGSTYYVRIFSTANTGLSSTTGTFVLCITTPPTNDECLTATSTATNAGTSCAISQPGNLTNASASIQTNGCAVGDDDDDLWYSFVAGSTSHSITISTGSAADFYHSVYAGTCPSLGSAIMCSDPNSSILYGLTIGSTYYVRVYSVGSSILSAGTGTFDICINTPTNTTACFNPPDNDFCPTPTSLSQSPYTFTGAVGAPPAAGGIYTSDAPGNLGSVFGGSIEGNSWYSFIAVTTTHTFNIVPSGGCTIEARVLNVAVTNSCCTSFTSMSNFYSSSISGVITATALTTGVTYYLMVDGISTTNCSFSIPTWVLTTTLPLEYVSFTGNTEGKMNVLEWVTASENDKSKFTLEHSKDGIGFESIITINGKNLSGEKYIAYDKLPFEDITYYRLKHTDNSNQEKYSNIISVNLKNKYDLVTNIHPNPANNNLNFDYYSKTKNSIVIQLLDYSGKIVLIKNEAIEEGKNNIILPLAEFDNGVYILKVFSDKTGNLSRHKIIKN